ncbi:MAG: hypothetical protein NVSMB17_03310 [Candidatus Dormibacteria bacterium]
MKARRAAGPGRVEVLDAIRAVAIVLVVVYHARNYTWQLPAGSSAAMRWLFAVVAEVVLVPVPAFVVISGVVMASRPRVGEGRGAFVGQRLRRVGIPLLCWSALAIAVSVLVDHAAPPDGAVAAALDLLLGRRWYPLYFLVVALQLYALAAFLPRRPDRRRKVAIALIAVQVVADLAIQLYFVARPDQLAPVSRAASYFGIFWCGYFVVGVLAAPRLKELLAAGVRTRLAVTTVALVSFAWLVVIATTGGALSYYQSPIHFVFASATTLCAGWALQALPRRWLAGLAWLGLASFGIYLCHGLVLPVLGAVVPHHWIQGVGTRALLHWGAFSAAGLLGATALTVGLRRIGPLRPLLGEG